MLERWTEDLRRDPELAPIADFVRARIALTPRIARKEDHEPGASRLGGAPDLPAGVSWPMNADGPIGFVGQVNLADFSDPLLPADGLLSFFAQQGEELSTGAVLHVPAIDLVRRETPRACRAEAIQGIDVERRIALPPWSSRFIAIPELCHGYAPLIPLSKRASAAYGAIHARWLEQDGGQHGLLGYDRPMEGVQTPDEIVLLRLDHDGQVDHDFIEADVLYFLIARARLLQRDFSATRIHYGRSL